MNRVFINLFSTIIIFSSYLFSGTTGQIRGTIYNMEGEPLIGAQVYIEELGIGAVADLDGSYVLLNIPVGSYDVTITMISYKTNIIQGLGVIMDNTVWLNVNLEVEAIEGDVIYVSGEKALVEKGSTSKKVTVSQEAIEALPIRDVSELYSLQSGVVKVEAGMRGGIPDHEERGLEEVHVRGGRAGEIAYLIDGMYIRNPIYGGIGSGTRLNIFAIREFDWQPGGFNAEYGDAMSAVSNMHTSKGGKDFSFKYKYETSLVGAMLGSEYDSLRGYNDFNLGLGGTLPILNKISYWLSGQYTNKENYRVLQFDSLYFRDEDPDHLNKQNMVQPWDDTPGFRAFGFDKTWDVFGKFEYKLTNKIRFDLSYWVVENHRKGFNPRYLYWDEGQNELFRDTERLAMGMNYTFSPKTFFTVKYAKFQQDAFQGVRWMDSDSDGFPDWFEWSHSAGERTNYSGTLTDGSSDPYNPYVVPYNSAGDSIFYDRRDGLGPKDRTSGWYYVDNDQDGHNDVTPGNYNWLIAEQFYDVNRNGVYDDGVDIFDLEDDIDNNGVWSPPALVEECEYRDGSYWLTPEMYVNYEDYYDLDGWYQRVLQDPYVAAPGNGVGFNSAFFNELVYSDPDRYYFLEDIDRWAEGSAFGGHDRLYQKSSAITEEFRFDITSQITDKWRARFGIDLKSHKLNFYQVTKPWQDEAAIRQRFSEQWDDFGLDSLENPAEPDIGEGNGIWDPGEVFDDFNGNGKWDDYVEPIEIAGYFQNTFEVPWMVINAGIRVDAVNYRSKIWSKPNGDFSPLSPWVWDDCGLDGLCPGHGSEYIEKDEGENDGEWNYGEAIFDEYDAAVNPKIFFENSIWQYKLSPRFGVSHVITDAATFTFNYGLYHQMPVYEDIYLNTNRQEDPIELIQESEGSVGNATMFAQRTQSYEFAFNVQVGRNWAYSIGGWVKDMDQLSSAKTVRSQYGDYSVSVNADYGMAKGFDLELENRGQLINTTIQYTYSEAKGNGSYSKEAFGGIYRDAPTQEYVMPFDRPHDLTISLYSSSLPFGITAGLNAFYQSGVPYTGVTFDGGDPANQPRLDELNKNSKRMPAYKQADLSLSRVFTFSDANLSLGMNIFNIFDTRNVLDVYEETGNAESRSEYYTKEIGLPENGGTVSNSFYDRPWMYSSPREINFFIRIDYK